MKKKLRARKATAERRLLQYNITMDSRPTILLAALTIILLGGLPVALSIKCYVGNSLATPQAQECSPKVNCITRFSNNGSHLIEYTCGIDSFRDDGCYENSENEICFCSLDLCNFNEELIQDEEDDYDDVVESTSPTTTDEWSDNNGSRTGLHVFTLSLCFIALLKNI